MSTSEISTEARWTLVFASARWCDPAIPMAEVFGDVVADIRQLRKDLRFRSVTIDIDDEEQNHLTPIEPPRVSTEILASIDFVPLILLVREESASEEQMSVHGEIVERFVGQLPRIVLRERILSVIEEGKR